LGVEASLRALEELNAGGTSQRATLSRKLEQLVHEARKALEQYDAVDARNRLAASELERRGDGKLEDRGSQAAAFQSRNRALFVIERKSEYVRWAITLLE
jgi:hypothetical protein